MRFLAVAAKNYRSLQDFRVEFSGNYNALSGKNNSGKTGILNIIRELLGEESYPWYGPYFEPNIDIESDFTTWLRSDIPATEREIRICGELEFERESDPAFFDFFQRIASVTLKEKKFSIELIKIISSTGTEVEVKFQGNALDDISAKEISNWLRGQASLLIHDSTAPLTGFYGNRGSLFSPTDAEKASIAKATNALNNKLKKVGASKREHLQNFLSSSGDKFKVDLRYQDIQFDRIPFLIGLSQGSGDSIDLDQWGSGTKNRTAILSLILRAGGFTDDDNLNTSVTPVIVIEEPEAFLHPSAQANFGRTLEDLADSSGVQLIVSTHSPYLLASHNKDANVLIQRDVKRKKPLHSFVASTDGENWAAPFAAALCTSEASFSPLSEIFFGASKKILVVEGEIDQEYLLSLRACGKDDAKLHDDIEIFVIDGMSNFNSQLLQLLRSASNNFVLLFDADQKQDKKLIERLNNSQLEKGKNFLFSGTDAKGHRTIEHYVPQEIKHSVRKDNPDLIEIITSESNTEAKAAKSRLKRLYCDKFKTELTKTPDIGKTFVPLIKDINKAFG